MPDLNNLQRIIDSFLQCNNRSEAEIRSKFAVPLLEWLEYPIEFRSEEFPVYGFEGSRRLPTKNADFLLFDDKDYKRHDQFRKNHIDWVKKHSLLILETKKPEEMPEVLGQPQFYTIWTKAVAYIATDGNRIIGCIYNPISADEEVVNCDVKDLANTEEIKRFAFPEIKKINDIDLTKEVQARIEQEEINRETVDPDTIKVPQNLVSYMRSALGKNATGLSDGRLLEKYLRSTDFYLQQDMRYDVPEYMFDIPRGVSSSMIYLDDSMIPYMRGDVYQYYRDDLERLSFQNDYLEVNVLLSNDEIAYVSVFFHVLDYHASERIHNLQRIEKLLQAKKIRLKHDEKIIEIPLDKTKMEEQLDLVQYWLTCMNQIITIEEYFDIKLILHPIESIEESEELYRYIDAVYKSITKERNITFCDEGEKFFRSLKLTEPVTVPVEPFNLESIKIHNYMFKPTKMNLIPDKKKLAISVEFIPEGISNS